MKGACPKEGAVPENSARPLGSSPLKPECFRALRGLFDNAHHFVGLVDAHGLICYANPFSCAFVGCEESSLLGQPVWDSPWWSHSAVERDKLKDVFAAASAGRDAQWKTTHLGQDGSLHVVECDLRPIHSEAGQVLGFFMEGWDIGPQLRAEGGLHSAERLLDVVIEQSPVSMVVADARDGVLKAFNRAAVELIGTARAETFKGRPLHDVVRMQDWQELSSDGTPIPEQGRPLARALRGETVPIREGGIRRADGTVRQVLASATPVYQADGTLLAGVVSFWDVTAQNEASKRLLELANEQRTILNAIKMGICLTKRRMVQWTNPEFLAMFGCSESEVLGSETRKFYDDDSDYRRIGAEGYAHLSSGLEYATEARMRRADGDAFWCRISGQALAPANVDDGAIWVLQDVSERRHREEALQRSEHMLSAIVSASPEIIIVSRIEDGRFVQVNEAFIRLTGFEREEVIGRTSLEIALWPSSAARAMVLRRTDEYGELRNQEAQLRHKSGHLLDVLISGATFIVDDERLFVWIIADIGDYKRAKQAVQDTEERFRHLVESSSDIIAITDTTGNVLTVVGPMESVLGYKAPELTGAAMRALLHPDDVGRIKESLAAAFADRGSTNRFEFRLRNREGGYVQFETVCRNLLNEPTIGGIVWNIRDITERKQAEAERARLQEQLEHAMRMEAVGRLAGGVAHDFNNLLTVIGGNIDMVMDGVETTSPLRQPLEDVAKASASAASLTRQLLAYSRRQMVEPKNIDLNEIIANLLKMLTRLVGEDVTVVTRFGEQLGTVRVDPTQFEQVVVNLAVNARDAMPSGGYLTLETSNVDLDEAYAGAHEEVRPGPYVMLAVSDSGQGMTSEVRCRLFEPFFTTKARGKGTGLGLAMIFGAVRQARGTIEVYSEIGHGTVFKIYLPRVDEPVDKLGQTTETPETATGDETVLVVEDEETVRSVAATMLTRLGYTVLTAANGEEALRLARTSEATIDVLLTDIVMPGMNGRELAELFRELHPETRVLYTSGYTEDVILHHGIEQETVRFVGKPYTVQSLATKLRQVIGSRTMLPPRA